MFSTFMLQLLAEIYSSFPELGDSDRPELVLFIDEAHVVFENASKSLLGSIGKYCKIDSIKGDWNLFCNSESKRHSF